MADETGAAPSGDGGRTTFPDLGLSDAVLRAVADVGYTHPTPIQKAAIPLVLMNRDVLGCAQTGTGKTASFTLPMIDILASGRAKARMPRSLILEPTRELAAQVAENFDLYGKYNKLTHALLIGGESFGDQERKLDRGTDVLIATPGRLIDLFERGKILLSDVKVFVIDEADRMLDMGFIPDVERIAGLLPPIRQTLFFSATMPREIRRLADAFLMNPKEISVAPPASTADTVMQGLAVVSRHNKREALRALLGAEDVRSALIFCNRKRDIGVLHRSLERHGFDTRPLHGDLSQPVRTDTLEAFRRRDVKILVCSDVAARGIDIDDLSHVFNFDVPSHAENYVHRIGRTGRAGRSGRAYTLATPDDGKYVQAIETLIGKAIPRLDIGHGVDGGNGVDGLERQTIARSDRRRGGSGGIAAGGGRTAALADPPRRGDGRAAASVRKRPAGSPTQDPRSVGRNRRGDRDDHADSNVVGFGDHVPHFLLRPTQFTKSDTGSDPEDVTEADAA